MPYALRFRPEAQTEAAETRAWYEERQAGLGAEFTTELEKLLSFVREGPHQFPRVHGEVRRAVLNRFPYAVYFRLSDVEVIVLAVHGRQNPERWQSRR